MLWQTVQFIVNSTCYGTGYFTVNSICCGILQQTVYVMVHVTVFDTKQYFMVFYSKLIFYCKSCFMQVTVNGTLCSKQYM